MSQESFRVPQGNDQQEGVGNLERKIDLSKSVVGFRIFKIGKFNEDSLTKFNQQISRIVLFADQIKDTLAERSPRITLITNDDLPEEGKRVLASSNLDVIETPHRTAHRRATLGKKLIGEQSQSSGEFSYSDMLNSLTHGQSSEEDTENCVFVSSDLAGQPRILLDQIMGMDAVANGWKTNTKDGLAMVGTLIEGIHDQSLIQEIVDGSKNVDPQNLSKIFPNNALSLVKTHTKFSGISDNALSGKIEINGKMELIGGNEDFLYGFKEMLFNNKDCVLLIDPFIAGERQNEIRGIDSKYLRRQTVYKLYMNRYVEQYINRNKISIPDNESRDAQIKNIAEDVLDNHLFFARINSNGEQEVILTQRQKEKNIESPI